MNCPVLKSSFTDINTQQVKDFLNKPIPLSWDKQLDHNTPQLTFCDTKEIPADYYDFTIDGLTFYKCWIQPQANLGEQGTQYQSGTYRVIHDQHFMP